MGAACAAGRVFAYLGFGVVVGRVGPQGMASGVRRLAAPHAQHEQPYMCTGLPGGQWPVARGSCRAAAPSFVS